MGGDYDEKIDESNCNDDDWYFFMYVWYDGYEYCVVSNLDGIKYWFDVFVVGIEYLYCFVC